MILTVFGNRFPLGQLVITRGAYDKLSELDVNVAINRHVIGDWGELDERDREENDLAVDHGGRLMSRYNSRTGTVFWIITEYDRSVTTILLPLEY